MLFRSFVNATINVAKQITQGPITVKSAEICLPPDTIVLKRPHDYQYRTWFRSRKFVGNSQQILANWIKTMDEHVHASPSLRRWLSGTATRYSVQSLDWTLDHYFVDHNDAKLEVWLAMVCPGIVRKTQAIQSPAK
mgnify:FL=1